MAVSFEAIAGTPLAQDRFAFFDRIETRGVIMEGVLLQTVEGLGESLFPGELWELLQAEKESIAHEITADGPLRHDAATFNESEPWDEADEHLQRRHRNLLESRLRELNDAQDRLLDGGYGVCGDCEQKIGAPRLNADPAVSLCLDCQQLADESTSGRAGLVSARA